MWRRAVLGSLLLSGRLLTTFALQFDIAGTAEGDRPDDQDGRFGQLQAALRAAEASLASRGLSAASVRAAVGRLANAEDSPTSSTERRKDPELERAVQSFNFEKEQMSKEQFEVFKTSMLLRETAMLSDSQHDTLKAIQSGSVRKRQIEIVLAHYNETVEWARMYAGLITPYCKGDQAHAFPYRPVGCRQLPNVGRESHTFLTHIIDHYDNLADWTVFTQAQVPTVGWSGDAGDERHGHMAPGATFHDYVLGGGPFSGDGGDNQGARFVFNGQWKPPVPGTEDFDRVHMAFGSNYWSYRHEPTWPRLNRTCLRLTGPEARLDLGGTEVIHALLAYVDMLNAGRDKKYYTQGARFALTRERIRQRPRSFYESVRRGLEDAENPIAGVFTEFLWYYIPGGGNVGRPCKDNSLTKCPQGFEQLGETADDTPEGRLATFPPSSMEDCGHACRRNPQCGSFEYHTHHPKLCHLLAHNVSNERAQLGFYPGATTCKLRALGG